MAIVAVTGGTGQLGRLVVERLSREAHTVRVLTSGAPTGPGHGNQADVPGVRVVAGDLADLEQLSIALQGVDTVVHCASNPKDAQEVDVAGTSRLLDAMRRGGSGHLVYVSIVGVDDIPVTYYRAKWDAERLITDQEAVPWTIQRATQFHSFVADQVRSLARLPVLPVPAAVRFQPVAASEVADRLVEHVASGPRARVADFGGPQVLSAKELAQTYLQAVHRRRLVVRAPLPGRIGQAYRRGANLCPDHADGRYTWEQFLADDATAVRDAA
jgi:uncharacterized protein YbjT (DUF2867 family)